MAKKPDTDVAKMTAEQALGGQVIPLNTVIPAGKPSEVSESPAEPAPTPTPPTPGSQIRRRAPGRVMIDGLGEVDAKAGLPAFLTGLPPEKQQARELIKQIRRDLAQQITALQTILPAVASRLADLEGIESANEVAQFEGFDIAKARDIARELQEAVDRAAK